MCCLINVTSYLLGGLMEALEKAFMNEGGLRERMARAGINKRNTQ
jgi:four helix bundle suffix protein